MEIQEMNDACRSIGVLEKRISDSYAQIEVIKGIDWSKPVTVEEWHRICETPLRGSKMLCTLISNTFPLARDVRVSVNYILFNLFGFNVKINMSRWNDVEVDTSWYVRDKGAPTKVYSNRVRLYRDFLAAKENGEGWYKLATLRLGKRYKKRFLFFMWFFKYKWKKDNKEKWGEWFTIEEGQFEERVEAYNEERREMFETSKLFFDKALPILESWTVNVKESTDGWHMGINDIETYYHEQLELGRRVVKLKEI